jgi:hypothetical protein
MKANDTKIGILDGQSGHQGILLDDLTSTSDTVLPS